MKILAVIVLLLLVLLLTAILYTLTASCINRYPGVVCPEFPQYPPTFD